MRAIGFVVILLLAVVLGCDEDDPGRIPIVDGYRAQTSPENVVHNLEYSYRRREATEYSRLLHPDFIFVFQPQDAQDLDPEFWTRDQDTTQTKNLFEAISVPRIAINLIYGPATPISEGSDTMAIRVNPTLLEVDELGEEGSTTTWLVDGDIQDLFFVRGDGPDSTRWYLIEWRDIPGSGFSMLRSPDVESTTWGKIKSKF